MSDAKKTPAAAPAAKKARKPRDPNAPRPVIAYRVVAEVGGKVTLDRMFDKKSKARNTFDAAQMAVGMAGVAPGGAVCRLERISRKTVATFTA